MEINWTFCCLCQSNSGKPLQIPTAKGLQTLERELNFVQEINAVPIKIPIEYVNEDSGIAATLKSRNTKNVEGYKFIALN